MTIRHDEAALTERSIPGPALYLTSSAPANPRAIIGVVHGYGDHAARYSHVMDAWAELGIASIAIDLRGHGRAAGQRGHCMRFDEFLDDAVELSRLVSDRFRGVPAFLFGHSFGGLVAVMSVLEAPRSWRGLILSAPFLGLALDAPKAKIAAGKVMSRIAPRVSLPSGLTGAQMTHDEVRARDYDNDPLGFKTANARWFTEARSAQALALTQASRLYLPLYVLFGGADPVAQLSAAKRLFDHAASPDKTFNERPGLLHETLNEPEWPSIARALGEWVLARAQ
ncbi:MAG: lysophospholipase [Myxococcales bacterium]|jgi:alpha-beta hydrolase superfamily lysophospholipase